MSDNQYTFIKCSAQREFEALRQIFYFKRTEPFGLGEADYSRFVYTTDGTEYVFPDELTNVYPDHKIVSGTEFISQNFIDWEPKVKERIEVSEDGVTSETVLA
jgi:hypothetical protein